MFVPQEFTIPGYCERLVTCLGTPAPCSRDSPAVSAATDGQYRRRQQPAWSKVARWVVNQWVFLLATVLLLTWPYRLTFSKLSNKVYVVFIKELQV